MKIELQVFPITFISWSTCDRRRTRVWGGRWCPLIRRHLDDIIRSSLSVLGCRGSRGIVAGYLSMLLWRFDVGRNVIEFSEVPWIRGHLDGIIRSSLSVLGCRGSRGIIAGYLSMLLWRFDVGENAGVFSEVPWIRGHLDDIITSSLSALGCRG